MILIFWVIYVYLFIMESVFELCVKFLNILAELSGLSYQQVNVIIFCIIWPVVTIYLIYKVIKLKKQLRSPGELHSGKTN